MRMRMARSLAGALAGAALIVAARGTAHAQQLDVNPPLPNVLLLVDNSGSMERMIDGSVPEDTAANACNISESDCTVNTATQTTTCFAATSAPAPPPANRWNTLVTALTGSMAGGGQPSCIAMSRAPGSTFASEYSIAGVAPYDQGYYLRYHRMVSLGGTKTPCVFAPGNLPGSINNSTGVGPSKFGIPGNATDFPANAIVTRPYGQTAVNSTSCAFGQNPDGVLDTYAPLMRFGLMTFDQDPDPGIGVTTSSPQQVLSPPFNGMWSYFQGWNGVGSSAPAVGAPVGCTTSPTPLFEVGARNPAAPPWEGRMMPFPTVSQDTTNLQSVLLATRPYGATPIAGMFSDAQYYLWKDSAGPNDATNGDQLVRGGCRKQYIILLTDGVPNLDLQPNCGSTCPYPTPDQTALTLSTGVGGAPKVTTYVIGFAVSQFADGAKQVVCSQLDPTGTACTNPTSQYAACCELQKIAVAGGTQHAYFADTAGALQAALKAILDDIASSSTTRTTPAFSPSVANVVYDSSSPNATSTALYSAAFYPSIGVPWSGTVQRQRYVCTATGSAAAPLSTTAGDDFAANLNTAGTPATRMFAAVQPDPFGGSSNPPNPTATIRPFYQTPSTGGGDKIAHYGGTLYINQASNVIPNISDSSLQVGANSCQYTSNAGLGSRFMTADQCASMVLSFTFAQGSVLNNAPPSDFSFVRRDTDAFGDVFHSTPAVVGPPGSLLRDDGYVAFRTQLAARESMVYVATNDGLLHAFWADENRLENNERWALLPPAAMPQLVTSYPATDKFLLDGPPIVKDVVWDRSLSSFGAASSWHTTLVAGFGPSQRGYYAVDVTNPKITSPYSGKPAVTPVTGGGPVFLWQLVDLPSLAPNVNFPIFAAHSATPAITSLFMDPGDGKGTREIGVAILPGGSNFGPPSWSPPAPGGSSGTGCGRISTSTTSNSEPPSTLSTNYAARGTVRCWGSSGQKTDPVPGRAVAVVRLDTGEILRVFMRKSDVTTPSPYVTDTLAQQSRVIDTPLDSPMTGTPAVYPGDVGSDATKVFIADADGTIWKFDLSSINPSSWTGEMFLDLYNPSVDARTSAWADGQPVMVPPVLSLNQDATLVLNVGTGTQDTFDANGLYYVYSISEKVYPLDSKLRAQVNWYLASSVPSAQGAMGLGERVSGPMTVFDGTFYFATYRAPSGNTPTCSGGDAFLWGLDFVTASDKTHPENGGIPRLNPPPPASQPSPPLGHFEPSAMTPALAPAGAVIPGVTIQATAPCSQKGASGSDQYVGGATHQGFGSFSPPSFSLYAPVAAKGSGGAATSSINIALPTPLAPTVIDSWAAVIE
jgi:type IV pilus assembly protein PilY1